MISVFHHAANQGEDEPGGGGESWDRGAEGAGAGEEDREEST